MGSAFTMSSAPGLGTCCITLAFRSLYRLVPRKAATRERVHKPVWIDSFSLRVSS